MSNKHKDPSGKLLFLLETYTLILTIYLSLDPYLSSFIYYNSAIFLILVPQAITHIDFVSFEEASQPLSMSDNAIHVIGMLEKHQSKLQIYKDRLDSRTAQREIFKEIRLCRGDIKIWEKHLQKEGES